MRVESHRPVGHTVNSLGKAEPVRSQAEPLHGQTRDTGRSAELMTQDETESRDVQPMTTTCARCGTVHVSLTGEGRTWFRAHLKAQHPEVKMVRRRPTGRSSWMKNSSDLEARDEAMVTVQARRKLLT